MRKSIILFSVVSAYIALTNLWGCSSSESEDKYNLLTSSDKKLIATVCSCVEPLTPFMDKMMNAKDSAEALMYADSLEKLSNSIEPCIGDAGLLEQKANKNEKFTKQFIDYIREKHPKCLPFFLGVRNEEKNFK